MKWVSFLAICPLLFADFAFDLKQKVQRSNENWVFSPFSVSVALSMIADGAAGDTKAEIDSALSLPNHFLSALQSWNHSPLTSTDFTLRIAQGVWIREAFSILPSYREYLKSTYSARVENVRFLPNTATQINEWIEEQTNQKIKNLIAPSYLSSLTCMVLVNALYFKGSWSLPFSQRATQTDFFYPDPMTEISVPFMQQMALFPYFENERFQAVTLPLTTHSKETFNPLCLLFLPKRAEDDFFDVQALEDALHFSYSQKVSLRVPKFQFDIPIDLNDALQQLGIKQVFSPFADLSGINGKRDLFLSQVVHKAFFAFDESGIEAAAATTAIINCTTSFQPDLIVSFIANRPFYFALVEGNTGMVLFMGRVQKP